MMNFDDEHEHEITANSRMEFLCPTAKTVNCSLQGCNPEIQAAPDANLDANGVSTEFESALEREARDFVARSKFAGVHPARSQCIFVCDLEYIYDYDRYAAYVDSEGDDAERKLRWIFHRVAAAAWMVMRFKAGAEVPIVEEARTIARDDADEPQIVSELFDALERFPDAICTTWGGEYKDLPILRRCAGEFGLLVPCQLRNLNPYVSARLDLCAATSVAAKTVHLPEYAHACAIPTKPWPSKYVGALAQRGDWTSLREQALADVLTTSAIAVRHLTSLGIVDCSAPRSMSVLADGAAAVMPGSRFVRNSFAPWARGQCASSRLTGTIIRAA